eukprot:12441529-Alexandrium_andersonii.AAC.1
MDPSGPPRGRGQDGSCGRAARVVAGPSSGLRGPHRCRHCARWWSGQRAGAPRRGPGGVAPHSRGRCGQVGRQEVVRA